MKRDPDQSNSHQASPDNITKLPRDYHESNPIEDDRIEVYTDGSSINASQQGGPTGVGVVLRSREGYRERADESGTGTNITAELDAIRLGLEMINDRSRPVRLYTDSEYAVKALTEWIDGWRENDWKKSSGEPVAHQPRLKRLAELMDEFDDLEMAWVAGHAGHVFNERADNLAAEAAEAEAS